MREICLSELPVDHSRVSRYLYTWFSLFGEGSDMMTDHALYSQRRLFKDKYLGGEIWFNGE